MHVHRKHSITYMTYMTYTHDIHLTHMTYTHNMILHDRTFRTSHGYLGYLFLLQSCSLCPFRFSFLSFERLHGAVCPNLIGSSLPATHGGTRCHSRRSTSTGSKSGYREIESHTAPFRFGIVVAGVAVVGSTLHVVCHVGRLRRQQILEAVTELVDWSKVLQTLGVFHVVA